MHRRSIAAELAMGALGAAIIAAGGFALAAFVLPVRAHAQESACITAAEVVVRVLGAHPEMREVLFVGDEIEAVLELIVAPAELADAATIATFYVPRSSAIGLIEFFDDGGCLMPTGGTLPSDQLQDIINRVKGTPA